MNAKENEIIDLIYQSITDPYAWGDISKIFYEHLNANRVNFGFTDFKRSITSVVYSENVHNETEDVYLEHFTDYDPAREVVFSQNPGALFLSHKHNAYENFHKSYFYSYYAKPRSYEKSMVGIISKSESLYSGFIINRSDTSPEFDKKDAEFVKGFMPHLNRSHALSETISQSNLNIAIQRKCLNELKVGVILVNSKSKYGYYNANAQDLLKKYNVDYDIDGLSFPDKQMNDSFLAMTQRCLLQKRHSNNIGVNHLRYRNRLVFTFTPYSIQQFKELPLSSGIAIYIIPINQIDVSNVLFKKIYNLSEREYRLVNYLYVGNELKDIAIKTNRSIHTLKNQLRSVYQKTGTNSQKELLRLYTQLNIKS